MTPAARSLAILFVLSLALRLGLWSAVVAPGTPLAHDELGYFERAVAWRGILVDVARLEPPAAADLERAYGRGHWPPLHPLLLGFGLVLAGPSPGAARLVMVLVSALTTPLVFRLTRELAGERPAWAAGCWHLLYPTFCAYSHYLWSETTYLFLLLLVVWAAVRTAAASSRRRLLAGAAVTGALLGLTLLARAAALPFLAVVPAWLAWTRRGRPRALAAGGLALAAAIAVASPWQATLAAREGRVVPLTTLAGFNLALGNNPWVPQGYGSSWGHETSKARLFAALRQAAGSGPWEAAAAGFAAGEIRVRPGPALRRGLERLHLLWAPDFFPLRHLLGAVYPPLPPGLAASLCLLVVASYLALVAASLLGLGGAFRGRGLIAAMVVAGMVPAALTVGLARLHLPLLALLLPAAGRGTVVLLAGARRVRPGAAVAALAVCALSLATLPRVVGLYVIPSSCYGELVDGVGRRLGVDVTTSDRIVLRGLSGELTVEVASAGGRFLDGSRERLLRSTSISRTRVLDVVAAAGGEPLEIALSAPDGAEARLRPVTTDAWQRWLPTGIGEVEFSWAGAGRSPH